MAKARFDIPTQLPTAVSRSIFAGVGATDAVVAVLREAVADAQRRARSLQQDVKRSVAELDHEPAALRRQATQAVTAGVAGLQSEARELPARLHQLVDGQVSTTGEAYGDLVKRGETLVGRIRRQPSTTATTDSARTTAAKARTTRTQAAKTAGATKKSATRTAKKATRTPARSSAKATSTAARKTASGAARATKDAAGQLGG